MKHGSSSRVGEERSRRGRASIAAAALLVGALGCTTVPEELAVPPGAETISAPELLRLGPNDVVRVSVYGRPSLSTPETTQRSGTRIDPEGLLSLPLVGPVPVGGLTLSEARERITAAYAVYVQDPRLDVSVTEYASRRFYIYGEVQAPGAYPLDRPLTVYQALTLGGGFAPHAWREEIVLLREVPDGVRVEVIDGSEPDPKGLMPLLPDDFLFVRRTATGKFVEEVMPYLTSVSQSLSTAASLILIEDRVSD